MTDTMQVPANVAAIIAAKLADMTAEAEENEIRRAMSAVGFLGSSRQNRVLPVLTAFGLAGARHPEKAFGSPKNMQHNMELCRMDGVGGRGRGLSLRPYGGRPWQVAGKIPAGL